MERIAVWTKTKDEATNLGIGKRIVEALKLLDDRVDFDVCWQQCTATIDCA